MALGEETWRRETSWADTFKELKSYHDLAYRKIEEALRFDEGQQWSKALTSYEEGLGLIEKALSVNIECPRNPDFTWEKACSMVEKLRKTRKETLSRISETQLQRPEDQQHYLRRQEDLVLEPPPSYEEAMATPSSSLIPASISSLPHSFKITPSSSGIVPSSSGITSSSSSGMSCVTSLPNYHPPQTYSELGEALQNLKIETKMQSAKIIFNVENVHIYFITPDGRVSAPSQPNLLRILELEDGKETQLPKYFLQVGDWFYPLVPDVSPCYRSEYGAFILPDINSDVEGAAVGLVLPAGTEVSLQGLLEDILQSVVTVQQGPQDVPLTRVIRDTISNRVSKHIVTGAQYLSTGLIRSAERASQYINNTTPKIISHIQPEETPHPVPDSVRTGAKVARSVSGTAANVSGYIGHEDRHSKRSRRHLKKLSKDFRNKVALSGKPEDVPLRETTKEWHTLKHPRIRRKRDRGTATFAVRSRCHTPLADNRPGKVGSATMALGRYLAPHVQRGGTTLLSKVGVEEQAAAEGVGGVLTVAAGAVQGFGTVYTGLEQAASILGTSLANNTVQIVQHKYGEPMASVTGNTLYTVGNVINTTNNIQNLTPKGLAKKTAKDTGKALVEPHFDDQPSTSKKK